MSDVFISYSRKDLEFVTKLHDSLVGRQRTVWVDLHDIPPTVEWRLKIREGLEGARAFVFVISPASIISIECQKELAQAVGSHKRLIPLVYHQVDPNEAPELNKWNWLAFNANDFEASVETLLKEVDIDHAWVDQHTLRLTQSRDWQAKRRDKSLLLRGSELKRAEDWLAQGSQKEPQPTAIQTQYILASRQAETRRKQVFWRSVSAVFVAVLSLLGLYVRQLLVAIERGKVALSRHLAAESRSQLKNQRIDLAFLLSLAANRVHDTVEARSVLLEELKTYGNLFTLLHGHRDAVKGLVFSSDGGKLISCSLTAPPVTWDLENKKKIDSKATDTTSIAYPKQATAIAISADGKIMASSGLDHTATIVEVETQKALPALPTNLTFPVVSIAIDAAGNTLALLSYNGSVVLWNVKDRTIIDQISSDHTDQVKSVALSANGERVALGRTDGAVELWDVAAKRKDRLPLGHNASVLSLAFSPNDKVLASASNDGAIVLWNVDGRDRIKQLASPLASPPPLDTPTLAFSPKGDRLASGNNDCEAVLWDMTTHERITDIPLYCLGGGTTSLAFSRDGNRLARGLSDGTVAILDVADRLHIGQPLPIRSRTVTLVAFTPDDQILASGNEGDTLLWEVPKRKPFNLAVAAGASGLAFSDPDGQVFAQATYGRRQSQEGIVELWDVPNRKRLNPLLTGRKCTISCLAFDRKGKTLAIGTLQGRILLWDMVTHKLKRELSTGDSSEPVARVAFSPDGNLLASGHWNKTLILWDLSSFEPLALSLSEKSVGSLGLAFSPDGKMLAVGCTDGKIYLWDVVNRRSIGTPIDHGGPVSSVSFDPFGKILASGGADNQVILWDVGSRQRIGPSFLDHGGEVTDVAISHNGKLLASGARNGSVFLWDIDIESWKSRACRIANRDLTAEEKESYLGDKDYAPVCEPTIRGQSSESD